MTAALTDLTLAEARDGLQAGSFSSVELTRAHSAAVERARPLNAFITETPDLALGLAEASDARRKRGGAAGPSDRRDGRPSAAKFAYDGMKGIIDSIHAGEGGKGQ